MYLTLTQVVNGILSVIYVLIVTILGLLIASKYRKYKENSLIYAGLGILGLGCIGWGCSLAFLTLILTGNEISDNMYIFASTAFIPLFLCLWIYAMTELISFQYRKILLFIYAVVGFLFEIYFIYYIFTDYTVIGTITSKFDMKYFGVTMIYVIFVLCSIVLTAIWFAYHAIKSDNPEIVLKGKFIIIGVISWGIGVAIDAFVPSILLILILIRILFITGALEGYIGFVLPQIIKNIFIRTE